MPRAASRACGTGRGAARQVNAARRVLDGRRPAGCLHAQAVRLMRIEQHVPSRLE